jgi:hypothetical protein
MQVNKIPENDIVAFIIGVAGVITEFKQED